MVIHQPDHHQEGEFNHQFSTRYQVYEMLETSHTFKECTESKCVCGKPLAVGQVVCYNYDAHPSSAQFKEKIPRSVSIALDAYRRGKAAAGGSTQSNSSSDKGKQSDSHKGKARKGAKAFAATVRSDAETVLKDGAMGRYLEDNGYVHELSTPEAHYQNFVERYVQTINKFTSALLHG